MNEYSDPILNQAFRFFRTKQMLTTELDTQQMQLCEAQLLERAYFMACVDDMHILQGFRQEIDSILQGKSDAASAHKNLLNLLETINYKPNAGEKGTIKDLTSFKRMMVTLKTNTNLARGYGLRLSALKNARSRPAWEYYRQSPREKKRRWEEERWIDAYEITQATPGAISSPMVAILTHPIWQTLSVFSNPYPIFDWNSGMWCRSISAQNARNYGLLNDPAAVASLKKASEEALKQPFNTNLQASFTQQYLTPNLKKAIAERMRGIAHFEGGKLIASDLNGITPQTPSQLIQIWQQGVPDDFAKHVPLYQKKAAIQWVRDSSEFKKGKRYDASTNYYTAMERLIQRLQNEQPTEILYRGMSFSEDPQTESWFLDMLRDKIATSKREKPADSWTTNLAAAEMYAKAHDPQKWSILYTIHQPTHAKDFTQIVKYLSTEIGKTKKPSIIEDSEWLYASTQRFQVVRVQTNRETRTHHITLAELKDQ